MLRLTNWCVVDVISLEDAYEALRVFEILAIEKKPPVTTDTCHTVLENLGSSSSPLKDLFYALKVSGILKCDVDGAVLKVLSFCFYSMDIVIIIVLLQLLCSWLWLAEN